MLNERKEIDIKQGEIRYLFLIMLDIMYFPYLFHLPIKISMFLLLFWLLKQKNNAENNTALHLFSFCVLGTISVCMGILRDMVEFSVILTDIQALIIILYGYAVFEFVRTMIKRYKISLNSLFVWYLGIAFLFMLLYWFVPDMFFQIRPFWTLRTEGEEFVNYAGSRFSFIASEPNNFAALIVAILAFLNFSKQLAKNEKIVVSLVSLCLVISTSSISGTFYYCLVVLMCLFFRSKEKATNKKTQGKFKQVVLYVITAFSLVCIVAIIFNSNRIFNTNLIQAATGRYDLYFTDKGSDFSGDRLRIWKDCIENNNFWESIFFGYASVTKPHSGHLYIIYAFGFVMYVLFMKLFFFDGLKNIRSIIVRGIFMAVFTMNTLIVDLRSFTLFAVLLAASCIKEENENRIINSSMKEYKS